MEVETVCRCCLSEGRHKDLWLAYAWLDKKEVYAEMLKECFNIVLATSHNNSICETCIRTLRSSVTFRQQVLHSEQSLFNRIAAGDNDVKPVAVKLEPKEDCDSDDSDDYFLADAVRNISEAKIKTEESDEKVDVEKKAEKDISELENIRNAVNKLGTTIKSCDKTKKKKKEPKKKRRKVTINKIKTEKKPNWRFKSRSSIDKVKHKENLQTILKFSNVVPFKNKSLLGYVCGYCNLNYPDPLDLRTHTEKEHKKDRLNLKTSCDLTEYNVKVDITDLTCTLCDGKIDNLNLLKDHLLQTHKKTFYTDIKDHIVQFKLKKGDIYDCSMCTATYETFKMLKQHMNMHYCNYTCVKCNTSFATKRSLNAHQTTHIEGSFKCDYCDKVFASNSKKHYHEKTKHMGARSISNCPFCDEPFRSYYQRNQHLIKVHNSEAQYKCNVCSKAYILKSLLMCHIKKSHLMERNCQCTECGFRFFSKKALKAHMVKHTGERNFVCEVCHKSYARKYTLTEHMRIHNNDRRFKCEVCTMSFVQKCSLKSHLLSNHGISMAASDITSSESVDSCS